MKMRPAAVSPGEGKKTGILGLDDGGLKYTCAFALARCIFTRRERMLQGFYAWFDGVFRASLFGGALRKAGDAFGKWSAHSFCFRWAIWVLKLFAVPAGQPITEGTFVGVVLILGAFVPTSVQMFCFALGMFLLLWRRWANGEAFLIPLPFRLLLPFILLFMFVVGAALSSVVPGRSMLNLALWGLSGLFLLISFDIAMGGKAESVIWPFLSGASISGFIGIYQYFSGWRPPESWVDVKFEDEIVRVVGTFKNPNYFAEMIGLILPITLALLIKNRHLRDKCFLLIHAVIQTAALVFSWSRGAWLGFLVSFAVMAVLFDKKLLLLGLVAAMLVVALAPPVIVDRLLSSFSLEDSSNNYRLSIWRGSIALIKKYLFRGVGLGAESFSAMYPEYMIIQTPAIHSHSTYLQLLIELGLPGFAALMWFFAASMWISLKTVLNQAGRGIKRWRQIGLLSGSVAAVVGHMFQGVIDHTWYNPQIMLIVWAWVGIAIGTASSIARSGQKA